MAGWRRHLAPGHRRRPRRVRHRSDFMRAACSPGWQAITECDRHRLSSISRVQRGPAGDRSRWLRGRLRSTPACGLSGRHHHWGPCLIGHGSRMIFGWFRRAWRSAWARAACARGRYARPGLWAHRRRRGRL